MSLRLRLFLLLGSLVAALVLAELWLVRSLSHEVSGEVGQVAFRVGESVAASLSTKVPASSVSEREIRLREVDGRLEIVDERVRMGFVARSPVPSAAGGALDDPDVAPAGAAHLEAVAEEHRERTAGGPREAEPDDRLVVLSVASPPHARFLTLSGPGEAHRIPIPRAGIEGALDDFQRRLLGGSAIVFFVGLLVAGVIAHRVGRPLRELATAASAVEAGALGAQVPSRGSGEIAEAITAFNRMSRRLEELDQDARRLRAQEHLRELGEIARGLAHGLRNPLNALGLSLDELAAEAPAKKELAAAARRQIRRIDQSVRSFLALASSGRSAPTEDLDVVALVQDVVLEVLQDGRGSTSASVEVEGDVPRIHGVAAEIRAVVQALLVNALEASPEGARVRVAISAADGGGARVVVEDEGSGLAPEVRERLFTPHVTTKPTGAGMGLYIAHRIVTARHGGTLELLPREPRGMRAVADLRPSRLENGSARG